ncbi:MAG TPA: sugar ABC transporter permease [Desulfobulbus sp.]|nr:sugar ABC transporter permease [Desulfobulbus sp.]
MREKVLTLAPPSRIRRIRLPGKLFSRQAGLAYLLSAPAVFLMLLLLIGPVLLVCLMSFTDYQLGEQTFSFTGLENYRQLFSSEEFWKSLRNTIVYVSTVVPVSTALGLGIALLVESCKIWKAFYRAVYFLPVMATLVAMAIVWSFVLNPDFGLLNLVLHQFGFEGPNWLNDPSTALFSICCIGIWQTTGFNMVLFMAGLSSIPRELYDAAEIDGAGSAWDQFRTVTWPLLGPVTFFVVIISSIRSFQVFDLVQVLTKGGPNKSTEVLIYSLYTEGFSFFRTSYAAAISVVFLVFVVILTLIKSRFMEKKVHYS